MKRKAALAMAICMAVGMLTGCGGPKEAGKAGETKESVAQADTAADADGGEAKNEQAEGSEAKAGNDGEEVWNYVKNEDCRRRCAGYYHGKTKSLCGPD
ncbi:hypothetical protein [Robinsoniella peoriensis]